jgi:hypothetical protein
VGVAPLHLQRHTCPSALLCAPGLKSIGLLGKLCDHVNTDPLVPLPPAVSAPLLCTGAVAGAETLGLEDGCTAEPSNNAVWVTLALPAVGAATMPPELAPTGDPPAVTGRLAAPPGEPSWLCPGCPVGPVLSAADSPPPLLALGASANTSGTLKLGPSALMR